MTTEQAKQLEEIHKIIANGYIINTPIAIFTATTYIKATPYSINDEYDCLIISTQRPIFGGSYGYAYYNGKQLTTADVVNITGTFPLYGSDRNNYFYPHKTSVGDTIGLDDERTWSLFGIKLSAPIS